MHRYRMALRACCLVIFVHAVSAMRIGRSTITDQDTRDEPNGISKRVIWLRRRYNIPLLDILKPSPPKMRENFSSYRFFPVYGKRKAPINMDNYLPDTKMLNTKKKNSKKGRRMGGTATKSRSSKGKLKLSKLGHQLLHTMIDLHEQDPMDIKR